MTLNSGLMMELSIMTYNIIRLNEFSLKNIFNYRFIRFVDRNLRTQWYTLPPSLPLTLLPSFFVGFFFQALVKSGMYLHLDSFSSL